MFAHLQNCLTLGTEKYFQVISVSDASDFKNHEVPTWCILVEITAHWQLEYFFKRKTKDAERKKNSQVISKIVKATDFRSWKDRKTLSSFICQALLLACYLNLRKLTIPNPQMLLLSGFRDDAGGDKKIPVESSLYTAKCYMNLLILWLKKLRFKELD